jgi:hypothetical protein
MRPSIELVTQNMPSISLSKKWTFLGIATLVGSFFLHPDACISSKDVLSFFAPNSPADAISHIGLVVGGLLSILGEGALNKKTLIPVSDSNSNVSTP